LVEITVKAPSLDTQLVSKFNERINVAKIATNPNFFIKSSLDFIFFEKIVGGFSY